MNTNLYYTDQELRTQRTNLEAMGYYPNDGTRGGHIILEINEELVYRASQPPHPSNLAFGLDEDYGLGTTPYDQDT